MRVRDVRCHVLLDPTYDPAATSSAQDTIVVEVETDAGITGIGETDLNAWIARACIEAPGTHTMDRGLRSMLIGRNPLEVETIWRDLYVGSAMSGRRGAVVHALGALDIALWDIRGKAEGKPVWQLLGRRARERLTPYASLQPETRDFGAFLESIVDWAGRAAEMGFTAVKLETTFSGPYAHKGLSEPDGCIAEVVEAVRRKVGPDLAIMVDVQYAFDSVDRALRVLEAIAPLDVLFCEAPLWPDDLPAYAELSGRSPVPIAAGEWLSTRHEFADLIDRGGVHVAQPDIARVGGLSETLQVCALAAQRDRLIVPHAWKTGISIAAAAHLAMVTPHMPFFEFLPASMCESALRRELVIEEVVFQSGELVVPSAPGLGIELNTDALARFAEAARRCTHVA